MSSSHVQHNMTYESPSCLPSQSNAWIFRKVIFVAHSFKYVKRPLKNGTARQRQIPHGLVKQEILASAHINSIYAALLTWFFSAEQ